MSLCPFGNLTHEISLQPLSSVQNLFQKVKLTLLLCNSQLLHQLRFVLLLKITLNVFHFEQKRSGTTFSVDVKNSVSKEDIALPVVFKK